ncbi:hypothetical protein ACUNWD_01775 [Sunxiuqinia sp. A32]|uniref:hypothetical protein n=1 Tax=Sunxiuqinia sp. A32 TaxID=3461496 RepID=UPI0040468598
MKDKIEFKELDIQVETNWIKRTIWTPHGKKTILYVILGAILGLVLFLLTTESKIAEVNLGELFQNVLFGGLFGLLITNSPCARNKC